MVRSELSIELTFRNKRVAEVVGASLKPDSVRFPRGLSLAYTQSRTDLLIRLGNRGLIDILLATTDEIISHIELVIRTLDMVKSESC